MTEKYKRFKRIKRKLIRYSKGKGEPLTDSEKSYFKIYLLNYGGEEASNSPLMHLIENSDALEDKELVKELFDDDHNIETQRGSIDDNYSSKERKYEDVDYTMQNLKKNKKYSKRNFSDKLYKYCEDLTAKDFKYNPAIGRDKELEELMITILTPYKSAILTGKPGVGKTAIVEGLAYNIQNNNVPDALKGYAILQTSASILNSSCSLNGMLEKRVLELFTLLSNESKVILFIDEIHTLVGTGRSLEKTMDIANIIKPYLTSNDICLIGATTLDEYDEFVGSDTAFQRRFSPIEISEPDDESLVRILIHTMDNYSKLYKVKVNDKEKDYIAKVLVKNTISSRRNYFDYFYNPDLSITIIASAFGYARLKGKKEITIEDIAHAYSSSERVNGELKYERKYMPNKEINNKIIKFKFN